MRRSCPFPPGSAEDRGAGTVRCLRAEVIPRWWWLSGPRRDSTAAMRRPPVGMPRPPVG